MFPCSLLGRYLAWCSYLTMLMRVSVSVSASVSLSLSLCVSMSVSLSHSLCLCPRLYPRSGCTRRWRPPCSIHLSPAISHGVRVLEAWDVVVLVAVDVIVVGLLFLLLILVVLLVTEPSVDAIVVCCRRRSVGSPSLSLSFSLSLFSDLFPLVLFYLFSLGQVMF